MTVHYVSANGLRFAYLSEGEGPLVLMLHGFPDTAHSWDDLRPKVAAKGYRAVSPFMRGYTPTEVPADDATVATLGGDVLALIDALGAEQAVLIGHDWGAAAAYAATSMQPNKVRKLMTVAIPHPASIRPSPLMLWGARHFIAYKLSGAPARFAKDNFAALPEICRRWSPTWSPSEQELAPVRECFSDSASLNAAFGYYRAANATLPPVFKQPIKVPSCVFAGTDDPNIAVKDYEKARRCFAGEYTIEVLPGGHFLHREHPEPFAERVLKQL